MNQNSPLLSIIIPAYNTGILLKRCLDSLMPANNPDFEILIVNDGSHDCTSQIGKAYADAFHNVKYIFQENKGVGSARNNGLDNATGEYIFFLDSDDYLELPVLREGLAQMHQANHELLRFLFKFYDGKEDRVMNRIPFFTHGSQGIIDAMLKTSYSVCHTLFSRDMIERNHIRFPVNQIHEDIIFILKAYFYSRSSSFSDKVVYHSVRRQNSIVSHIEPKHLHDLNLAVEDVKIFLIQNGIFEEAYAAYLKFCYILLHYSLYRITLIPDDKIKSKMREQYKTMIKKLGLLSYLNIKIASTTHKREVDYILDHLYID